MPSGAKKRKALKKKQQEATGTTTTTNKNNPLHGNDEIESQDEKGSDTNSSSPASQGNDEFGTFAAKEISVAADVTGGQAPRNGNVTVETSPNSVSEIAPVETEKSEHVETSKEVKLVKHKSHVTEEHPYPGLDKDNGKVVSLSRSAAETSEDVESSRGSEVPESTEEKRLSLPGPQAVRTSWLSCCGLFDAMTGSER